MGEGDQAFVHAAFVAVLRDSREEFWRNAIDGREVVLDGPEQAKHFLRVLLKTTNLPRGMIRGGSTDGRQLSFSSFDSPQTDPWS
jgi:hypothetical protein